VDDFSSQGQVSVEPGMPETSSISSDVGLLVALALGFGVGCDLEAWTIGVGPNDFKACVGGIEVFTDMEGDDGRVISGEEILLSFLEIPVGCLAYFTVTVLRKLFSAPLDGVEG